MINRELLKNRITACVEAIYKIYQTDSEFGLTQSYEFPIDDEQEIIACVKVFKP